MGAADSMKDLSKNKTSVGLFVIGLLAAGSYARNKAAGKGKAEAREPDMSRFPADE